MKKFWRAIRKVLSWLWKNRELVEFAVEAAGTAQKKSLDDEKRREVFEKVLPPVGSDSDRNLAREIAVQVLKKARR